MTTEMMMIMRFIERNMEEHMSMAVAMYGQGDYVYGHTYIERVCAYGHARKILLNGGTKEDIQKLADEYCGTGKSHIWFTYDNVAKEIDSIEQFIKCGLYKNAEREAENQQWIFVGDRLPEPNVDVLLCDRWGDITIGWLGGVKHDCFVTNYDSKYHKLSEYGAWMPLPKPAKFE